MGIVNINYNVDYEVKLSKNTYWVPISSIGMPKYTEKEIINFIGKSPEIIKASIYTLYDAVQLFQLGNFTETNDNKIIQHNALNWEFHKPGYYSLLTNQGCCASDTSWLLYILGDKFEQVGVVAFVRASGNGHSLNYIKYNDWFYFIDLLAHVGRHKELSAPETGCLADFARSRYCTGIFIKSKSINDFINYYKRFSQVTKIDHLFYSFSDVKTCIPIAVVKDKDIIQCVFPVNYNIRIYDNDCNNIKYCFDEAPIEPEWEDKEEG